MCSHSLRCLERCFLNKLCVKNQNAIHQQQAITLISGGKGLNKEGRRLSFEIRQDCPQHAPGSKELQKCEDRQKGTPFLFMLCQSILSEFLFIRHVTLCQPDQGVTSSVQNSTLPEW